MVDNQAPHNPDSLLVGSRTHTLDQEEGQKVDRNCVAEETLEEEDREDDSKLLLGA